MALKRPDYAYRHPSRDDTKGDSSSRRWDEHERDVPPMELSHPSPIPPESEVRHVARCAPMTLSARRPIDVTFAVPAHGHLTAFSAMTDGGVEPRVAILVIGKRALRLYEASRETLDHPGLLERFGTPSFEHSTRRVVDDATRTHAWGTLDPFGVRSGREIGRLLGRVAIQHWLETEEKLVS